MFDAKLRPLIDPPLNSAGRALAGAGVSANMLTLTGLVLGLAGAVAIASQLLLAPGQFFEQIGRIL